MSEDRYANVRELPFDIVAGALGIDITRFRKRKSDTEWAGPCPVHQPKKNSTSFSYSVDGRWNCFSCGQKGRGAIDLAKAVRSLGFQEAVAFLEPYAAGAIVRFAKKPQIKLLQNLPPENPKFNATYEKYAVESAWLKKGASPLTP